ncbi:cupin domain-containing protein [Dictyobacter formicarum]|uniref:Cupin n=1 Tax=Dictyobacter formicarum TaxID=2778368 RepID=A0ABQ3VTC6_9CHLR|nr:cupin domain-containing protein [Dictyobacter formicarum]GHO89534.1 cupin [Dictyobacter formicarum]
MITSVSRSAVDPLKHNRGGRLHVLLSPKTVGTSAGFLGTFALSPGEVFLKHYHPYSEECFYVVKGEVVIEGDENTLVASEGTGVFIPKNEPHRLRNVGTEETVLVFFCSPLAPSPDQGHVMLEEAPSTTA